MPLEQRAVTSWPDWLPQIDLVLLFHEKMREKHE